jgi:hypothetical protein
MNGRPARRNTSYCYAGDADPSVPGGMTVIYRDLMASEARTRQVITDVAAARP